MIFCQPVIEVRQIGGFVIGYLIKDAAPEQAKPIIDVAHIRRPAALVVAQDRAVAEDNVAAIPLVVVAVDGHQAELTALVKGGIDRRVVAIEVRVAIEDKELVTEQW